jgi:hypothetical protein
MARTNGGGAARLEVAGAVIALFWPLVLYHVIPVHAPVHSTDSICYVQMADGLLNGPARPVGFRPLDWDGRSPTFNTTFPVGYPILIAAVSLAGIDFLRAALVVPFLCYCANGFLLFRIVSRATNVYCGLAVSLLFSSAYPTLHIAWTAWSETPAITAALISLGLLPTNDTSVSPRAAAVRCVLAGIAAGLTVWIRYAMLPFPAAVAGALAVFAARRSVSWPAAVAGAVCALLAVVSLVVLNVGLGGAAFGPYRPPAEETFFKNVATMANHITYTITGVFGERSHPIRFAFSAALFLALLVISGDVAFRRIAGGRTALPCLAALLFTLLYPVFIVYTRARTQYDPIDVRFMAPFLAMFGVALLGPAIEDVANRARGSAHRATAGALVVLFVLGIPITWYSVGPPSGSRRWRFDVGRQTTGYPQVASAVPDGVVALVTNSHELAYVWDRGPAIAIDRPVTRAIVQGLAQRIDTPVYLFIGYDHPAFEAARFGPFIGELFADKAVDMTELVFDDGKARLWRVIERRQPES